MTDTVETRWESHNEAGRRLFSQGDHAAAEQEFIAAIREATLLGADNVRLASSLSSLGQIKYRQKDLDQAQALFRRALAIRERVLGADHFSLVQAINNLATLHYSRGELDQAAKHFTRALEICDKNLGEKHPDVAVTLNNLARLHFRRNDYVAAAPLLMRLLSIKQEAVGAHHPEVAVILTSLAKVRLADGQLEDAEQLARRALLIREEIHQAADPAIATSLETLADVLAARGLLEDEQRLRKRAESLRAGMSAEVERVESAPAAPGPVAAPPAAQTAQTAQADQAALAPQAPEAPQPRRTTRTASLPWIEPPTSPALRRPKSPPITAPRPVRKGVGGAGGVAGRTPAAAARDVASAREAQQHSSARAAGSARQSSAVAGPVSDGPHHRRREVILDPAEARRKHPWLKAAIAAVIMLGCGGGAWVYLTSVRAAERVTASAGATLAPSTAQPTRLPGRTEEDDRAAASMRSTPTHLSDDAGAVPSPSALTASADPAYGTTPPLREPPPAAAYGDQTPNAVPPTVQRSLRPVPPARGALSVTPAPADSADTGEAAGASAAPAPDLSRVNVDRITTAIGDNAKARADSLGSKTITVKAPVFEKPSPRR